MTSQTSVIVEGIEFLIDYNGRSITAQNEKLAYKYIRDWGPGHNVSCVNIVGAGFLYRGNDITSDNFKKIYVELDIEIIIEIDKQWRREIVFLLNSHAYHAEFMHDSCEKLMCSSIALNVLLFRYKRLRSKQSV